jgi:hypothetical protein
MTSDGKVTVTPGPWRAIGGGSSIGIYSDFDEHTPISDPAHVASLFQPHKTGTKDIYADAAFIVAAVNACFQVSPDKPRAVAEAIVSAFEIVRLLPEAHRPYDGERMLILDKKARALLSRLGIEERT